MTMDREQVATGGRTAIVTGGGAGLGLALVEHLRERGWDVVVIDLDRAAGEAVAESTGARFYLGDVANPVDWRTVIDEIGWTERPLGKVFLNAGVMSRPPAEPIGDDIFEWLDKGAYQRVMRINVEGALLGLRAVIPALAAGGGGSVTVTASAAGLTGLSFDPFYAMSKHAVVGMVRSFAPVLKRQAVRLNVFCPGAMKTAIVPQDVIDAGYEMLAPEDAARSCLEVSDMSTTGGIWVLNAPGTPLWPYETPPVEMASKAPNQA